MTCLVSGSERAGNWSTRLEASRHGYLRHQAGRKHWKFRGLCWVLGGLETPRDESASGLIWDSVGLQTRLFMLGLLGQPTASFCTRGVSTPKYPPCSKSASEFYSFGRYQWCNNRQRRQNSLKPVPQSCWQLQPHQPQQQCPEREGCPTKVAEQLLPLGMLLTTNNHRSTHLQKSTARARWIAPYPSGSGSGGGSGIGKSCHYHQLLWTNSNTLRG